MITASPSIVDVLARARAGLARLDPVQAWNAVAEGAVLVDIRPAAQRVDEGEVPGTLVVERNVLEWRFDPRSEARVAAASPDLRVIVLCSEGYTSSLAAAALQQVGVHRATDVIGGYRAWAAAGLPTRRRSPSDQAVSPARETLRVDTGSRIALVGETEIDLTRMEFDLLAFLVARPDRVHTRGQLLATIWPGPAAGGTRTVDVHVHRLRSKLGPPLASSLVTVRGVGYRWSPKRGR